jgi:hypothetical protein
MPVVSERPATRPQPAPLPQPAAAPAPSGEAPGRDALDDTLYLTGRPALRDYLRYVRTHGAHPPAEGLLTDEWEAAAAIVRALEKDEAGAADGPPIDRLSPEHTPLLAELLRSPLIRHGFNTVPTEIALVELDRLVVYQKHIDLTHATSLARSLPPTPTAADLFSICLPSDLPQPPVTWSRTHRDKFVFISPSNDLRFLGVMELGREHISNYAPPGNVVGVVGIAVGFGSNFLNAVYAERRLILRNGSHRAYALRSIGVTHVPCIVQHARSREELDVVASSEMRRDPNLYLRHRRPPMLRDYFNPALHSVLRVHRRHHVVSVTFDVDENVVPAL